MSITNGDSCVSLMRGTLVRPVARYPASIVTDASLKIAANQVEATLVGNIGPGDTILTLRDASQIVKDMLLTIDNEIVSVSSVSGNNITGVRGFDGTIATSHASGRTLRANIDAWHHNALAVEVEAIEAALGPNLSNISGVTGVLAGRYAWAQSPGGSLVGGVVNTVTLSPVPLGVNGTDKHHYVYISGGTGAPEPVLIVGGTATAGSPSGTILFTPVNDHTGAWSIATATAGGQEALQQAFYSAFTMGIVYYAPGPHEIYAPISLHAQRVGISGAGIYVTLLNQHTPGMDFIRVGDGVLTGIDSISVANLTLGPNWTGAGTAAGIHVMRANLVRIDNVFVFGNQQIYRGIDINETFYTDICHSVIDQTVNHGVHLEAATEARLNVVTRIWLTVIGQTGSDAVYVGDHSIVVYVYDCELYGMKNGGYAIRLNNTIESYGYYIRGNDISASWRDTGVNAGGIYVSGSAEISDNVILSSDAEVGIRVTAGSSARIMGNKFVQDGLYGVVNDGSAVIVGNSFNGSNASAGAIAAGPNSKITHITGCHFLQFLVEPIQLDNNAANITISGNSSTSSPGGWTGHPQGGLVESGNFGVQNRIPTYASAATVAIDYSPTAFITGSTTIVNLTGGWTGRIIQLLKSDAGTVTVGAAGGNIVGVHPLATAGYLQLVFVNGLWYGG